MMEPLLRVCWETQLDLDVSQYCLHLDLSLMTDLFSDLP